LVKVPQKYEKCIAFVAIACIIDQSLATILIGRMQTPPALPIVSCIQMILAGIEAITIAAWNISQSI